MKSKIVLGVTLSLLLLITSLIPVHAKPSPNVMWTDGLYDPAAAVAYSAYDEAYPDEYKDYIEINGITWENVHPQYFRIFLSHYDQELKTSVVIEAAELYSPAKGKNRRNSLQVHGYFSPDNFSDGDVVQIWIELLDRKGQSICQRHVENLIWGSPCSFTVF